MSWKSDANKAERKLALASTYADDGALATAAILLREAAALYDSASAARNKLMRVESPPSDTETERWYEIQAETPGQNDWTRVGKKVATLAAAQKQAKAMAGTWKNYNLRFVLVERRSSVVGEVTK